MTHHTASMILLIVSLALFAGAGFCFIMAARNARKSK